MTDEDIEIFEKNHIEKTRGRKQFKISKEKLIETIEMYNGMTFDIAMSLGCTAKQLYIAVDKYGLREELLNARKGVAEKAQSVLHDALNSDNEKIKTDVAKWLLSKLDPATYGDKPTTAINVNANEVSINEIFGIK